MSHPRHVEPLPLGNEHQPYSKGLMARALVAVGVPIGRAYELAKRIEQDLAERNEESVELDRFEQLAVEVLGDTEGMRLHRSHWIAADHVARLKRDNGKLFIVTRDGMEMPVSRPYADAVRHRFG